MRAVFQYRRRSEGLLFGPLFQWLFERLHAAGDPDAQGPGAPDARKVDDDDDDDDPWARPEGPNGELEVELEDDDRGNPADCGETSPGWRVVDVASVAPTLVGLAYQDLQQLTTLPLCETLPGAPWARWTGAMREVTHWYYGADVHMTWDWRVVVPIPSADGRPMWAVVVEASGLEGEDVNDPLTISVLDLRGVNPENERYLDDLACRRLLPPSPP
jgi:hypothetical protein